jgi:hypothetical protein
MATPATAPEDKPLSDCGFAEAVDVIDAIDAEVWMDPELALV